MTNIRQGTKRTKASLKDVFGDLADDITLLRSVAIENIFGQVSIGTTVAKARTNAAITFCIGGTPVSLASTDDFWTLAGATLAAGISNKWILCANAAGAASAIACLPAATMAAVRLPALANLANLCVIGTLCVAVVSSTFVPGTTSLAAGTITVTYIQGLDPGVLPQLTVR